MFLTTILLLAQAVTIPNNGYANTRVVHQPTNGSSSSYGMIEDLTTIEKSRLTTANLEDGISVFNINSANTGIYLTGYGDSTNGFKLKVYYDNQNLSVEPVNVSGYCHISIENDVDDDTFDDYFNFNFLDWQNQSPIFEWENSYSWLQNAGDELSMDFYYTLESETSYQLATSDVGGYFQSGYQQGYNEGMAEGETAGETTGYNSGYQDGYSAGYEEGFDTDDTALTIFTGIINVGLLPVNFFLQILNFEVFGINIGAIVSATLTIAIVVIIIRVITGKKND